MSIYQIKPTKPKPSIIRQPSRGPVPSRISTFSAQSSFYTINQAKISYLPYTKSYPETQYSDTGEVIYAPPKPLLSYQGIHAAQANKDIMINSIIVAAGSYSKLKRNPLNPSTFITLSSSYIIDNLPLYDQTNMHVCICASSLTQINAALRNLSNLGPNPQIDINHLLTCFPGGKEFDLPYDPRSNNNFKRPTNNIGIPILRHDPDYPDTAQSEYSEALRIGNEMALCQYVVGTIMKGVCFPIRINCATSEPQEANQNRDPNDCNNKVCVKNFRLKGSQLPPKTISWIDVKTQINKNIPIRLNLVGALYEQLRNDSSNNIEGTPSYTWTNEPATTNIGSHAILIIGYTETNTTLTLHCQNSWGSIPFFDIVLPIDQADHIMNTSIKRGNMQDDPVLWDFTIEECVWFYASELPEECCAQYILLQKTNIIP